MAATIVAALTLFESGTKNPGKGFLGMFLNGMMATMFAGVLAYLLDPSLLDYAVALNGVYMFIGLSQYLMGRGLTPKPAWSAVFGVLMVLGEALMGYSFTIVQSGNPVALVHPLTAFVSSVNNYWFLGSMGAEMSASIYLLRAKLGSPTKVYLALLLPSMIASPALFNSSTYVKAAVWEGSVIMILIAIYAYEYLYRNRSRTTQQTGITLELVVVMLAMMGGEFAYFVSGSWLVYSLAEAATMVWFVYRTLNPTGWKSNYLFNAKWTFAFLILTFTMEWFMGGSLDFATSVFPMGWKAFSSAIGFQPLTGGMVEAPKILFDAITLFGAVTGSAWFLVMMGTEMGSLVLMRIPSTKNRETKIRFGLMLSAYALYTVYAPYFSPLASSIGRIPFIGWTMGLGTAGPVEPALLLGIVGTYVVSFLLSAMFGGRQICSMFCSAATMYQGTFYDSLKVYNRTSSLGRKTLTSRLRPWYLAVSVGVWSSLLAFAAVSLLDQTGRANITFFGVDPTVFLYGFYFNVLWYVIFFSAPLMGTYACATQGWCSWGTFNQFAGRIGFFKLKVRDKSVCVKCPTKDCAKACPVGLTDMPGSFIRKGEFKSSKCIGVGDCVDACPYDNIYFYDFRNWVRSKMGLAERQPRREHPDPNEVRPATVKGVN